MRQNLGIRRRLTPLVDNDKRRWQLLNAILLSLMGTPIIYYGDEIGMGDNIWLPDRHGCRTPMQWTDGKNAGFSTADETYFPVNSDEVYGYQVVNVAAQEGDEDSYLNRTRRMLAARREAAALQHGQLQLIETINNPAVFAYWRLLEGQNVLCLHNLSDQEQSIRFDFPGLQQPLSDLLDPSSEPLTNLAISHNKTLDAITLEITLQPYASHWLTQAS